jgi:hypothetical protein
MDEKTAMTAMDAEKQPVDAGSSKPWYKKAWVLAGLGLLLAAVIAIPTAVVVTNNNKNNAMSSSTGSQPAPSPLPPTGSGPTNTNPTTTNTTAPVDDDDDDTEPPRGIMTCRRQDGTRMNMTWAEAGVSGPGLEKFNVTGPGAYPKEPVRCVESGSMLATNI